MKMATKKRTTAKVAQPRAAKKTSPKQTPKAATKSPKRETKATTAKPAKLSQLAAALKVLQQAKVPLTCKQIVDKMAKKGLWQSPGGKTPDQTLYASILRDIQKHGDASRFQKVDRG
jgi:hypothetical protein